MKHTNIKRRRKSPRQEAARKARAESARKLIERNKEHPRSKKNPWGVLDTALVVGGVLGLGFLGYLAYVNALSTASALAMSGTHGLPRGVGAAKGLKARTAPAQTWWQFQGLPADPNTVWSTAVFTSWLSRNGFPAVNLTKAQVTAYQALYKRIVLAGQSAGGVKNVGSGTGWSHLTALYTSTATLTWWPPSCPADPTTVWSAAQIAQWCTVNDLPANFFSNPPAWGGTVGTNASGSALTTWSRFAAAYNAVASSFLSHYGCDVATGSCAGVNESISQFFSRIPNAAILKMTLMSIKGPANMSPAPIPIGWV